MPSSPPLPVILPKPKQLSPHLNLAIYPPTVWIPSASTSPPPLSSATPARKQVACQWWKEQLLEARRKWEARQRFWCSNTSEERREAALSVVRIREEASVPFMVPTLKRARLMETDTWNAEHCSTNASVTRPPLLPPHRTSSATYPPSWEALVKQVKSPMSMTQARRPRKRQRPEEEEWKKLREDGCEVHDRGGMGGTEGKQSPCASQGRIALATSPSLP